MVKQYKVIWEERRYAIIKANSPEEAKEMVMKGEFEKDVSDEITSAAEAFELN